MKNKKKNLSQFYIIFAIFKSKFTIKLSLFLIYTTRDHNKESNMTIMNKQ